MINKIWENCFTEFPREKVQRHNFYLCQWQKNTEVGIFYLFYRWLAAIICLAILVCSLLDIGRTEEQFENHHAKWWIYLTHWGILACTIQAWMAAWIVTQGMMVDQEEFEIIRLAKRSRLHELYWILYNIATVYSFIITICYWSLVYNADTHRIDSLNIMVHVFNSITMLIDLAVVGHPITMYHIYWTIGMAATYTVFTCIYYIAGGTDRKNRTAIYPLLDWTKPGKSIVVALCAIFFVLFVHVCCYLLCTLRVWLFNKLYNRSPSPAEPHICSTQHTCPNQIPAQTVQHDVCNYQIPLCYDSNKNMLTCHDRSCYSISVKENDRKSCQRKLTYG